MSVTQLSAASLAVSQIRQPPPPAGLSTLRRYARAGRLFGRDMDPLATLLRVLQERLGKRLVFFEPGASDVSFDERWVLNLLDALRARDTDRYQFAMLSRLTKADAAEVHFVACKAARILDVST
ncbi:MAG: hypothetical protein V2I76_06845 [Roseobacter sp.]|jgi:hypothetical protein|nr:hypothetical protein [Roseobacter sp.]